MFVIVALAQVHMPINVYSLPSDVSKLDEPDGPPGQLFPPLHKLPASPSGAGKPRAPPPVVSPRPNARTRSESSPAQRKNCANSVPTLLLA